jgi:hypothetical protein
MSRVRFVVAALLAAICMLGIMQRPLNGQVGSPVQAETLAKDFVKAINDRSVDERKKILHPKTASCINSETQPFFDWIFSKQFKYLIPANYRATTRPFTGSSFQPTEAKFVYPVEPSHILQIDYSSKPFSSTTLVLSIVKEGELWYEVLPCPQPEAVIMAKSNAAKNRELEARAKSLAAELRDPLRTEIISLARDGHLIDAIKKYAEASGEDLTVANSVLEIMAPEN